VNKNSQLETQPTLDLVSYKYKLVAVCW